MAVDGTEDHGGRCTGRRGGIPDGRDDGGTGISTGDINDTDGDRERRRDLQCREVLFQRCYGEGDSGVHARRAGEGRERGDGWFRENRSVSHKGHR